MAFLFSKSVSEISSPTKISLKICHLHDSNLQRQNNGPTKVGNESFYHLQEMLDFNFIEKKDTKVLDP